MIFFNGSGTLPVDNVVTVTVVDALENLFHEDCCILLCELASGDDFIEELAALANSILIREEKG